MNNKLVTLMLAGVMALGSLNAEAARRMGGGKSVGQQSNQVTKRDAAPQTPAAPAQNAAPANAAKPAAPAPAAAAPKKPWGAMLGGLAAGLGLAWQHPDGIVDRCGRAGGHWHDLARTPWGRCPNRWPGLPGCGRFCRKPGHIQTVQPQPCGQRRFGTALGRAKHPL